VVCCGIHWRRTLSIAITLLEATGGRSNIQVFASDLDTHVLKVAADGYYAADKVNKVPAALQQKYFEKQADGRYRVKPVLRNMITFRQINLVENNWPIRNKFDAIFCRNVMIYFDRDTQYAVLKKFHPLLKQNGLLFVGHSENLYHATDLFKLRGKTVYELAAR